MAADHDLQNFVQRRRSDGPTTVGSLTHHANVGVSENR